MLIVDFKNAFNSGSRKLMLKLIAKYIPELAQLAFWLYEQEPDLITSSGDTIKSSTGTQQGCTLAGFLFGLLMKYIVDDLSQIDGLRVKLCFWDDLCLIGTPTALARAAKKLSDLEETTGLELKWTKCHLHFGSEEQAQQHRNEFPDGIQIHHDLDVEYLQIPVGSDEFVKAKLQKKLGELKTTIDKLCSMSHKHEAFVLLQKCASACRVTHIMRTVAPKQSAPFVAEFDKILRSGFQKIIGLELDDKWWRIAKLPAKYGGMALRSGVSTLGAQFAVSLSKASCVVGKISNDPSAALRRLSLETTGWLSAALGKEIDISALHKSIQNSQDADACGLSLPQQCEAAEMKKVLSLMDDFEKLHIRANSGPDHAWVTCPPFKFLEYNLEASIWTVAARQRLRLDVSTKNSSCRFCRGCVHDRKGMHALSCPGAGSTRIRHDAVRDIVLKAFQNVGYTAKIEHSGDLGDKRRPGDVIVYNWKGSKHLLIDIAVIQPLMQAHMSTLAEGGPGAAATAYESIKRNKYSDLNFNRYIFLPFVLEATGGVGKAAKELCSELRSRREAVLCSNLKRKNKISRDPLLTTINFDIIKSNGQAVLEREPISEKQVNKKLAKAGMQIANEKKKILEDRARKAQVFQSKSENFIWNQKPQSKSPTATPIKPHPKSPQKPSPKKPISPRSRAPRLSISKPNSARKASPARRPRAEDRPRSAEKRKTTPPKSQRRAIKFEPLERRENGRKRCAKPMSFQIFRRGGVVASNKKSNKKSGVGVSLATRLTDTKSRTAMKSLTAVKSKPLPHTNDSLDSLFDVVQLPRRKCGTKSVKRPLSKVFATDQKPEPDGSPPAPPDVHMKPQSTTASNNSANNLTVKAANTPTFSYTVKSTNNTTSTDTKTQTTAKAASTPKTSYARCHTPNPTPMLYSPKPKNSKKNK